MNELLNIGQKMKVVPQDFFYSNRGTIEMIFNEIFVIKLVAPPTGLKVGQIMEFYSQTKHGTLFFNSSIAKIDGDKIVVIKPNKHRFLQRRVFTRIPFAEKIELRKDSKLIDATSIDLAAGGIRMKSVTSFGIDDVYEVKFPLAGGNDILCKFVPVMVQRSEEGIYTVAGKFDELPYTDRMRIIQYCLRKDIEYKRK